MTQRMTRLARATLTDIAAAVARPGYARDRISPGIVHLGLGAFARAHLAVHVDDCLPNDPTWGIVGASLRKPEMRDALIPQDGLYTLAVRDSDRTSFRVIGAVMDVVVAIARPEALLARMAAPEIRIVSLTVTEKGYCRDPATGRLDTANPDIVHDIAHSDRPRSAPGYLVAALARRRTAGLPPFTVLCCDNLPGNGDATRRIVLDLADAIDPSLARWVEEAGAFPNTMVDRIVPATTDTDRAQVETALRTDGEISNPDSQAIFDLFGEFSGL
jgi:fructuronate reductase